MNFDGGRPKGRAVRVEDVARLAGVSPITVSRALSNPEKVREETRARVHQAVAETGYVVNTFASNLRSGRSTIVSVFVSNLQNPHIVQSMKGCADALAEGGMHMMIAQTNYSDDTEEGLLASILPLRPAAVVFTGLVQSQKARDALVEMGLPVMEMWDHVPDPVDMLVGFSNAEGGRVMGDHFGKIGIRKAAYVGRLNDRDSQRLTGFRAGVEAAGGKVDYVMPLEGTRTLVDGRMAIERILEEFPQCEGIFFSSDQLAAGALLHLPRVRPEHTIAIAGYGDIPLANELPVPLTTIRLSAYDMGQRAGRMVLTRLNRRTVRDSVVTCPVSLQARESTLAFTR